MKIAFNRRTIALIAVLVLAAGPLAALIGSVSVLIADAQQLGHSPWQVFMSHETGFGYQLVAFYFLLTEIALIPVLGWIWRNRNTQSSAPRWLWWAGGFGALSLIPFGSLLGLTMGWVLYSIKSTSGEQPAT